MNTVNRVVYAGAAALVSIVLLFAYISHIKEVARLEAQTAAVRQEAQQKEHQYQDQVHQLQQTLEQTVEKLEQEKKNLRTSAQAIQTITRYVAVQPKLETLPGVKSEESPERLPNAPSAQLVCFTEEDAVSLGQYIVGCQEWKAQSTSLTSQANVRDAIISSKEDEIRALEREKHPGFWKKTWGVAKIALPLAAASYALGRAGL